MEFNFHNFLRKQDTPQDKGLGATIPMSSVAGRKLAPVNMASMKDWMSNMAFIVLRILYTSIITAAPVRICVRVNGNGSADLQAGKRNCGPAATLIPPVSAGSFPVKNFLIT